MEYGIQSQANLSLLMRRSLGATLGFLKEHSSPLEFLHRDELEEKLEKSIRYPSGCVRESAMS